jgi:hypothetical protein
MTQTHSASVVARHEGATLGHQLASFRDIKEVEGTGKPYLLGISAKSEWETTIEVKALLEKHTPPGCRPAHRNRLKAPARALCFWRRIDASHGAPWDECDTITR